VHPLEQIFLQIHKVRKGLLLHLGLPDLPNCQLELVEFPTQVLVVKMERFVFFAEVFERLDVVVNLAVHFDLGRLQAVNFDFNGLNFLGD